MKPPRISGLYLIIDYPLLRGRSPEGIAEEAAGSGIRVIQFRGKGLCGREVFDIASGIQKVISEKDVLFIINDRVDVALAVGADGVHLGQEDFPLIKAREILGPKKIVGVSVHTRAQAGEAETNGADYIGVGPVFPSQTKQARPPLGCETLRKIRESVSIPVVPIGGITPENAEQVLETGVESLAVVSAVLASDELKKPLLDFQAVLKTGRYK